MREVVTRRFRLILALALLASAMLMAVLAAPAFSTSSPQPSSASSTAVSVETPSPVAGSPSVDPSPSPSPSPSPTITCRLSTAAVVFGNPVTVAGVVTPIAEGQEVVVTFGGAEAGRVLTDAAGAYELTFTPARSGDVVAALASDPAACSEALPLAVKPKVTVSHGALVPFLPSTFVIKVAPRAYSGVVTVKIVHRRVVVGRYRAIVRDGRGVLRVPLRGVDAFALTLALPADDGLAARSRQLKVTVRPRTLSAGSRSPYVRGMLTGLRRLAIRIPGMGSTFTSQVKDSVMAFQKAYGLSRTYVFNSACWRKLDGAKRIKPRYSGPSTHLEVDKTRQILLVVKNRKVYGLICVSTGATGNTPEGTFHIQQKHPFTTSGYGGILVRTMGFVGDFAIHGYAPVPPYPASHGCVREPIWACYWVYDHSWVGETLYVYR